MPLLKPCEDCGTLTERSRCDEHRPKPKPKPTARREGYDRAWTLLSERARKMQPFCLWCGATDDLQLDHTPEAWARKAARKPIRLQDVRVLCGPCNRLAGQARPGPGQRTSEERPEPTVTRPPTGKNMRRHTNPGGDTLNRGGVAPGVRQSLNSSPGVPAVGSTNGPEYPVRDAW